MEELLEAEFYNQCAGEDQQQLTVNHLDRVWSESSQGHEAVKYDHVLGLRTSSELAASQSVGQLEQ
jgi:hypothetical protein